MDAFADFILGRQDRSLHGRRRPAHSRIPSYPEQGYRACLGLLRLGKSYTPERLEAACARAVALNACSYKSVKSILQTGLDTQPVPQTSEPRPSPDHTNIRGARYFQTKETSC